MDLDFEIRKVIAELIHTSSKSRAQIADDMRILLPKFTVSVHMLNDFSAESKLKARFPAAWVPSFCALMNDDRLQRLVLSPRNRRLLEWAEMNLNVAIDMRQIEVARLRLLEELGGDSNGVGHEPHSNRS